MTRPTQTVVTLITDPIADEDSRRFMQSLHGFVDAHGSPVADGTPTGSRSVFQLDERDLVAGGLNARVEAMTMLGIRVHRVVGDHPAVRAANRRLGYI
jgi:hypothetical protein